LDEFDIKPEEDEDENIFSVPEAQKC